MNNFDYPQICPNCQGYKTMPYTWNSTFSPRMCSCTKEPIGWECPRCHKINSPFKENCNCLPFNPMDIIPQKKTDENL
jgi:hypothetical protein